MKRQSDFSKSLTVEREKVQPIFKKENISISCIEHLSNELFYEIFEYLACWEIYKLFSKLNSRFQHLIIDNPLLSLKIQLRPRTKSELQDYCQNFIIPNRHRILSLCLKNELSIKDFFTYCITDSSFTRLQSIVVRNISIDKSVIPLFHFKSLPHLFSLTMHIDAESNYNLSNIYRMILSFPSLKYNKISTSSSSKYEDEYTNIFVPLASNEKFSTIKYLIIDHPCTLNEIFFMLYHTPGLCHLTCRYVVESRKKLQNVKPITLYKLTHIHMHQAQFDDFVMFMLNLIAPVQVLRIKYRTGSDDLDANDWEELIKKRLPYLRTFNYEYHEDYVTDYEDDHFHKIINRFTSLFWIKHQWFFEFRINVDVKSLHCAIHPYRNIGLDIYKHSEIATYFNRNINYNYHQDDTNNSSLHLFPIIQLCINSNSFVEQHRLYMNKFKSTFLAVEFTRLKINCKNIPIDILIEIMQLLPNLDSLDVLSLPHIQSDWLSDNNGDMHFLTPINNKITNVNLKKIINIEQVHIFLCLCPSVEYFQMNIPKHMDFKMLVRFILIQANTYNFYLRFLCLYIQNANEDTVQILQKLIDSEKLLFSNYMIKRISNYILLKWNCNYPIRIFKQ